MWQYWRVWFVSSCLKTKQPHHSLGACAGIGSGDPWRWGTPAGIKLFLYAHVQAYRGWQGTGAAWHSGRDALQTNGWTGTVTGKITGVGFLFFVGGLVGEEPPHPTVTTP